MNLYELYEADNSFEGEEGIFYIIAGQGGSARRSNNHKYYIITQSIAGIYNADEDKMVKGILVATWPMSCEEYEAQDEETQFSNEYTDGTIYKVRGRLQYNYFGDLTLFYLKEVLEENATGTKLDKKREKYIAPIHLEDEVLGNLILEKSSGLFEGEYEYAGKKIGIYVEVEWSSKATWKRPLAVARDFIQNIETKDNEARTFIASVNELYEAALDWLDEDCEISFSTPEEFAAALSDRLKYIFVNQNGSYTIGYDDGCVFGGHEIDVDVNTKGRFVCAEMR
jgi:hypothetical protein